MLYNNQNQYTSALIVPNMENLKRKCKSEWGSLKAKEEAIELIQSSINAFKPKGEMQGKFPERWVPATFAILDEPFSEKNQMINITMKMVRHTIEKFYKDRIDYLNTSKGKNMKNVKNINALNK